MGLKENAAKLLSCQNPTIKIDFPLRSEYASSSRGGSVKKRAKSDEEGWISTKKTKTSRKSSTTKKTNISRQSSTTKKKAPSTKSKSEKGTASKKQTKKSPSSPEVIDISDDSDDEPLGRIRPSSRLSAVKATNKLRICYDSLFDDSDGSSENEF